MFYLYVLNFGVVIAYNCDGYTVTLVDAHHVMYSGLSP